MKVIVKPSYSEVTRRIHPSYSEAFSFWKLREAICDHFADEVRNGMKVLEVGCGAGTNIFIFNGLVPLAMDVKFIGFDISPKRIEQANEYKTREGVQNCVFKFGAAEKLECDEGEFDIVVCSEVLEHLPNPETALKEMYRVLKNGGCAVITTPNSSYIFKKILGSRVKDRIERDIEYPDAHQQIEDSYGHISVMTGRKLLSICKGVGFKAERIDKQAIIYGLPFYDRHQVLFALLVIADWILDRLPWTYNYSYGVILKLRKV